MMIRIRTRTLITAGAIASVIVLLVSLTLMTDRPTVAASPLLGFTATPTTPPTNTPQPPTDTPEPTPLPPPTATPRPQSKKPSQPAPTATPIPLLPISGGGGLSGLVFWAMGGAAVLLGSLLGGWEWARSRRSSRLESVVERIRTWVEWVVRRA